MIAWCDPHLDTRLVELAKASAKLYPPLASELEAETGEHVGLRASLLFAGVCGLLFAAIAWHRSLLRAIRHLPAPAEEATMSTAVAWDQGRRLAEPETWS